MRVCECRKTGQNGQKALQKRGNTQINGKRCNCPSPSLNECTGAVTPIDWAALFTLEYDLQLMPFLPRVGGAAPSQSEIERSPSLSKKLRLFQVSLAVLIVYSLFCAVVGVRVAEAVLHPSRHHLTSSDFANASPWAKDDDAALSEVSITSEDGVSLKAWELQPQDANGNTVLLLHGLRGNRLEMVNYADIFLSHGYSVLMPDARAHGESGGNLATYGLLERDDVRRWVYWLTINRHPHCIYGFGESMGAAELLQAVDEAMRFCAVAAEAPFSTLRETAYDRIGQYFHAGPWVGRIMFRPIVEVAFAYTRLKYGLNMERVSPEEAVAATHVPVLLIHGQSDTNIPIRHSFRIAARNSHVVVWQLPHTGHSNAIDTSPQELETRLVQWFGMHQY